MTIESAILYEKSEWVINGNKTLGGAKYIYLLVINNTPIVQSSESITGVYITIGLLLKVTNNILML